ncbi:MAG: SAM-dependent methyltransferase, partial [Gemmatimonadota bacterium]
MNLAAPRPGCVYIVGAGPGDPGLLTLKGAHLLAQADVVFHDHLLDPRLLDLCRTDCERVYAGHRGSGGSGRQQEELNQQLVVRARQGQRVVRLKGGDPYVFGRGGEEGLALRRAGVPFEVVAGVSAAASVPGCAGIPLTHRDV